MSYVSDNRAWLEPYFRQLIEAMNLGYWRITLEDQWPAHGDADTSDASCWHSSDYYRAKVYLNDPDGDMEELRSRIVHELVHLLLRDWDKATESVEDHLNPPVWSLYCERLRHEMEQAVDAIAVAWARVLPLPVREQTTPVKATTRKKAA